MDKRHTQTQDEIRTKRAIRIYIATAVWLGVVAMYLALILPDSGRGSRSPRRYSKNHLKMFGLAFHNYHDVYSTLPDEASGESWETQLLPYLDYANTYNSMDHTKPWNDPVNDVATMQSIEYLANPEYRERFDARGYGLSHYAGNSQWLAPGAVLNFSSVTDGTSHTILAGEIAGGFTPWAKPGNLRDPSQGLNTGLGSFGHPRGNGVLFLLGDGSVRFLAEDIDPKVLKALATPAGGEVIPPGY
jgi:hypothetical protein